MTHPTIVGRCVGHDVHANAIAARLVRIASAGTNAARSATEEDCLSCQHCTQAEINARGD